MMMGIYSDDGYRGWWCGKCNEKHRYDRNDECWTYGSKLIWVEPVPEPKKPVRTIADHYPVGDTCSHDCSSCEALAEQVEEETADLRASLSRVEAESADHKKWRAANLKERDTYKDWHNKVSAELRKSPLWVVSQGTETNARVIVREAARAERKVATLEADNAKLRGVVTRLASPEAFTVSRMATEEETARMKYAAAAIEESESPNLAKPPKEG